MCVFSSPKVPDVAPAVPIAEAPKAVSTAVTQAANDARRRAAGARGYNATLLDTPVAAQANTTKQTLLGGAAAKLG